MRILTPIFIEPLVGRILNIHPSLLPEFPGLNTHRRAIDAGRKVHGATVHFVTQELDGGPPVLQAQVAINRDDTERTLSARVLMREHEIFPLASRWFLHGRLRLEAGLPTLDRKTLLAPLDFDNVSTANLARPRAPFLVVFRAPFHSGQYTSEDLQLRSSRPARANKRRSRRINRRFAGS